MSKTKNSIGKTSPWSESCSVTYDKTLPTSIITKPWNSDHDHDVNFPVIWFWDGKVEGTAHDNFELDHVELSIYRQIVGLYWNGSSWINNGTELTTRVRANGTTNWSYQIDPMYIPLGKFKIVAHAVDKAGNIENSATIEFENSATPILTTSTSTDPEVNLSSDRTNNKINLKINNISKPSDYEILYIGNGVEKGLVGKITADEIVDSKYSKDFYLGICSTGGTCVGDDVLSGSNITVNISGGQTLTKTFTY